MIRLLSCGYHFIHRQGIVIDRPAGAGNYAFVFFKSDSEIIVNGRATAAGKHSFIMFQPATPHLYRELEKPFINDWFHCEGDDLADTLKRLNFPLDRPVQAADPLLISRAIREIQSMHRLEGALREEILHLDLLSLLAKLSSLQQRARLPEKTIRYFAQFSELRSKLYNSPQPHLSVDELAASVNLSKSYFQHIYKELFGCSVVWDMIHGRLEYAKYLLDNTTLSIAAISQMCGYESYTHFIRQFKKFSGMPPGHYRSKH